MFLSIAALVMIAGLVIYGLSTNSKAAEVGRVMFAFGLLALLLVFGQHAAIPWK